MCSIKEDDKFETRVPVSVCFRQSVVSELISVNKHIVKKDGKTSGEGEREVVVKKRKEIENPKNRKRADKKLENNIHMPCRVRRKTELTKSNVLKRF